MVRRSGRALVAAGTLALCPGVTSVTFDLTAGDGRPYETWRIKSTSPAGASVASLTVGSDE